MRKILHADGTPFSQSELAERHRQRCLERYHRKQAEKAAIHLVNESAENVAADRYAKARVQKAKAARAAKINAQVELAAFTRSPEPPEYNGKSREHVDYDKWHKSPAARTDSEGYLHVYSQPCHHSADYLCSTSVAGCNARTSNFGQERGSGHIFDIEGKHLTWLEYSIGSRRGKFKIGDKKIHVHEDWDEMPETFFEGDFTEC